MTQLLFVTVAIFILVGIAFLLKEFLGGTDTEDSSPYLKKKYLFDTGSEFSLYKTLLELYGDKYHIFPQINYSHLIEVKKMDWAERQGNRSRIDRKSADFVLCDKEQAIPQLIIELDGSAHHLAKKQKRDDFIDEILKSIGLPILHLKTGDMDREFIRAEVDRILQKINEAGPL